MRSGSYQVLIAGNWVILTLGQFILTMKRRSPTLEGFRILFRRPSLVMAEISWRWTFGLALIASLLSQSANTCPLCR